MKKTLAIVLAVLMAVAALSSFAFVVGGTETKADFEITRIFAADIDLTQAGVRAYEKIEPSTDYWTPGKSLCIAVEIRVWNRTLDGHAGAVLGKNYAVAVSSTTANLSFVQYAVTKVASYVEINNVKQLSRVSTLPLGTVRFDAKLNAGLFNVEIVNQITPAHVAGAAPAKPEAAAINTLGQLGYDSVNVYNESILGIASVKGYVATVAWDWSTAVTAAGDIDAARTYAANTIGVPVLNYPVDPSYVDYVVFLSAKHDEANAEGLGDLSAAFTTFWGDSWVSLYDNATPALPIAANLRALEALLGLGTGSITTPLVARLAGGTLQNFYGVAAVPATVAAKGYSAYLNLSELGFVIVRSDFTVAVPAGSVKGYLAGNRDIIRYDVYRYDPATGLNKRYVASYVTENLLTVPGAKAIQLEYDGGEVAINMWGNYILSTAVIDIISFDAAFGTNPSLFTIPTAGWLPGAALNAADLAQLTEIADLNKMHSQFATGIGQAEGYPILNDQFTANLAAPKFEGRIDNTYLAGTTVAVEVEAVIEGSEAGEELPPEDGEIVDGEVDIPTAGDATIAFVCAAAAILACAALAFVMKKAR